MKVDEARLDTVRKEHNLSLIILHGSQVDGQTHPHSDLDLAVWRQDRRAKLKLLALLHDLNPIFPHTQIDLSDLTIADPLLLFQAMSNSRLLVGDRSEYARVCRLAFHKHSDYQPFFKQEQEFVKNRLETYAATK